MGMQARQEGRMEQGLALLPKMLQSIEVLQLTTAELLAKIDQELERNETLVAETVAPEPELAAEPGGEGEDVREWGSLGPARSADAEDRKQAFLQNLPGRSPNLFEHIEAQLSWLDLDAQVTAGVSTLAARLDHRGLLTATAEELSGLLDDDVLAECLSVLGSLEPRGLGAPDPISAMLLQLSSNDPDFGDIDAMLRHHLEDLARNKLPEVARALGRPIGEMRDLLDRIKKLDPHPGAGFGTETDNQAVHPDVLVRLNGDQIEVEVDSMALPDLGIDTSYEEMARDRAVDREVQRYLRDKLRSARDLIGAVEQRKRTLARVTFAIMRHQFEFLVQGRPGVRALGMEQVAAELDLHPSTISRAIAGKFVQTDHGIFPLREFFDGDRRAVSGTRDTSGRMAIRDQIRTLVAAEDSHHPLSDDEVVAALLERNIKVARRTVAKYRKELGLASSWRRRTHA